MISQSTIADLRSRLQATRWPDAPESIGWSLGVDVENLAELVHYWADSFDFSAHQAELGTLPSRRVMINGIAVHLIHMRAKPGTAALPMLLTHGWPDSTWRYRKVLSLLSDPDSHAAASSDAFDVVVPDMPGFGFSERPRGAALNARAVAAMWAQLMTALGYARFAVAGGDIGSLVARFLALDYPDRVIAVHRSPDRRWPPDLRR